MVAKFTIDGIPALAALDRGKGAGADDPTVGMWESLFPCLFLQPGAAGDRHLFPCSCGTRNTSQSPPDRQRRDGFSQLVIRRVQPGTGTCSVRDQPCRTVGIEEIAAVGVG